MTPIQILPDPEQSSILTDAGECFTASVRRTKRPEPMSMKPNITTSHKLIDGRFVTITRNPRARGGEAIIQSAELSKGASWPLDALGVMLEEFQRQADEQRVSFNQTLKLPDGLLLRFAFAPGVPFVARPLGDEAKTPEDYRSEVLEAIKSRITPERMAEVFAALPADSQRRVAVKCFIEPPVIRRVNIRTRRQK